MSARVTGIGGVFFKAKGDPKALLAWYRTNLGIEAQDWGGAAFEWSAPGAAGPDGGVTAWCIFPSDSRHFAPSQAPFMVNYRVDDLDALLERLRQNGCNVEERVESSEQGRFGWVMDPDGNRIELWEPAAAAPDPSDESREK